MSAQGWNETLITATTDGATLTAAAAATALPAQARVTLKPNFFYYIGQQMIVKAAGRISSVITTPGTARFDIRFGASIVFDGLAVLLDTVAGHTTEHWHLEILMTCRAIGATANLFGQGRWECQDILGTPAGTPRGGIVAMLPWNTAPAVGANFDSTVSQQVDMFFTQTVATGSMTVHQFSVQAMN